MSPVDPAVGSLHLSDEECVQAIETGALGNDQFRHLDHVRLAWIVARTSPLVSAADRMEFLIRRFAAHHRREDKYHHTMTHAWTRLVVSSVAATREPEAFDAFVTRHPQLLDKEYALAFYTKQLLLSDRARAERVEPDLRPLP